MRSPQKTPSPASSMPQKAGQWSSLATALQGSDRKPLSEMGPEEMSKIQIARTGYIVAAGLSFVLSVSLWFSGKREEGIFVGIWVPSILAFGALMLAGRRERHD